MKNYSLSDDPAESIAVRTAVKDGEKMINMADLITWLKVQSKNIANEDRQIMYTIIKALIVLRNTKK